MHPNLPLLLLVGDTAGSSLGSNFDSDVCGWNPRSLPGPFDLLACPLPIVLDYHVGSVPSSWAPWTHRPYCVGSGDDPVCVYTNAMIPKNQGISIISTPSSAASLLNVLGHRFDSSHSNHSKTPETRLYEVKSIPNKGNGAFATRKIKRGSIIMVNHAVILAPMAEVYERGGVSADQARLLFDIAAQQLPNPQKLLSLAQQVDVPDSVLSPVQNAFNTNSFTLSFHQENCAAVFPDVARLNHACQPNCRAEWSEEELAFTIWTLRDIEPGEELSLTYIQLGPSWDFQTRQDMLRDRWHFKCTCSLCSASHAERAASNKRRAEFAELVQAFQRHEAAGEHRDAVKVIERLLEIDGKEMLLTTTAQLHIAAAKVGYRGGDINTTRMYVQRAEDEMRGRGFRNEVEVEAIRSLKGLLRREGQDL